MKNIGKPCAGKSHARFDEGRQVKTCSPLYWSSGRQPRTRCSAAYASAPSPFLPSALYRSCTRGLEGRQDVWQSDTARRWLRSSDRKIHCTSGLSQGKQRRPHRWEKAAGTQGATTGTEGRRVGECPRAWCGHHTVSNFGRQPDRHGPNYVASSRLALRKKSIRFILFPYIFLIHDTSDVRRWFAF